MSDIKCVVCGEPWDAWGVLHGDMRPWESKLFKAGAGCPACEGETPTNGQFEPETISDIENGDEDPIVRLIAGEAFAAGNAPAWVRPDDKLLWTCAGCGVEAIENVDHGGAEYRVPWKSKARRWYSSHPFLRNLPEREPAHRFDDETAVCEFCLEHCDVCGAPLCSHLDSDDENSGYPYPGEDYGNRVVCHPDSNDCQSKAESEEANSIWKSCYSPAERIEYMRDRGANEFDCLYSPENETREHFKRRWRNLLAQVRGEYFGGYASELIS